MLSGLEWLSLEVKRLDPGRRFYGGHLDLPIGEETDDEIAFVAGDTALRLRTPGTIPRGGLHTHFAFSTPAPEYDDWYDRLDPHFDIVEHQFDGNRSLYLYDPEGNCVEIGETDGAGSGLTGIFEIVLEVEDRDRAESFYRPLAERVVDRGETRRRTRLDLGPFDLELWEPQLGLADARGGVHVDIGVEAQDVGAVVEPLQGAADSIDRIENGIRIQDPDGHYLTVS